MNAWRWLALVVVTLVASWLVLAAVWLGMALCDYLAEAARL
jgi:hypothetical protein